MPRMDRKRQLDEDGSSSSPEQRKMPKFTRIARRITPNEPIHVKGNLAPGENIDSSCAFIRLSDSTSDEICRTEAHLLGGVPDLVKRLEVAAKATESLVSHGWQARQEIYTKTSVLLLSWADDDLRVKTEIRQLRSLFADAFCYHVFEWELPSGSGVYLKTINKVGQFAAENGGEGTLLIIYYGGHGYQDLARQSSGPIWISEHRRRRHDGDTQRPTELESAGLSPILAEQDGDVLLIFDCCQAVPSIVRPKGKGVISALSATGFESGPLGIAPEPGAHSFTHSLVDELAATANMFRISPNPQPISDIELHVKLVTRLRHSAPSVRREPDGTLRRDRDNLVCFEQQNRRTPHYQFLSAGKDPRPIYLKPTLTLQKPSTSTSGSPDSAIDAGSGEDAGPAPPSAPAIRTSKGPMVLIRVMLSGDEFDVQSWASWVLKCPSSATDVKIEGQWGSFSTLQIISLPLDLWDLMPKHPAISFIGFVTTGNEAARVNEAISRRVLELQPGKQPSPSNATTQGGIYKPKDLGIDQYQKFTEDERRFLLSEMIKTSDIHTQPLVHLIQDQKVDPDWLRMQLPAGHNMKDCLQVARSMVGASIIPDFSRSSRGPDNERKTVTGFSPHLVKLEEGPKSDASSLPVVAGGKSMKTGWKPNNGPFTSLEPRPRPATQTQPQAQTLMPTGRKRGRPPKSQAAKQNDNQHVLSTAAFTTYQPITPSPQPITPSPSSAAPAAEGAVPTPDPQNTKSAHDVSPPDNQKEERWYTLDEYHLSTDSSRWVG